MPASWYFGHVCWLQNFSNINVMSPHKPSIWKTPNRGKESSLPYPEESAQVFKWEWWTKEECLNVEWSTVSVLWRPGFILFLDWVCGCRRLVGRNFRMSTKIETANLNLCLPGATGQMWPWVKTPSPWLTAENEQLPLIVYKGCQPTKKLWLRFWPIAMCVS